MLSHTSGAPALPIKIPGYDYDSLAEAFSLFFGVADGAGTPVSSQNPLPVAAAVSADQDPVFDHVNAARVTVTTASATVIIPPSGCKYLRVHATADVFLRTDAVPAADAAGSVKLLANQPETIPVTAGVAVTALVAAGTATLYATPMRVR